MSVYNIYRYPLTVLFYCCVYGCSFSSPCIQAIFPRHLLLAVLRWGKAW